MLKKHFNHKLKFIKLYNLNLLYKSFYKNPKLSLQERQHIKYIFYTKFKNKISIVKFRNFCILTLSTHSVYKQVKLARNIFKNYTLNGFLPGWSLSSW